LFSDEKLNSKLALRFAFKRIEFWKLKTLNSEDDAGFATKRASDHVESVQPLLTRGLQELLKEKTQRIAVSA